jgi:PAS domain S-box-containing protein
MANNANGNVAVDHDLCERLFALAANATIGIVLADLDGCIVRASRAFCEMLGYDEEELVGRSIEEISDAEDLVTTRRNRRRVVDGELDAITVVKRYRSRTGEIRFGRTSMLRCTSGSGEEPHIMAFVQDTTGEARAEAHVRECQVRLEMMMRAASVGTWDVNLETGETVSQLGVPFEGLKRFETIEGQLDDLLEIIHADDRSRVREAMLAGETNGVDVEFRAGRGDDATRWFRALAQVVPDVTSHERRLVGVWIDITELKAAVDAVRNHQGLFETLAEESPFAMFVRDDEGRFVYVNRTFLAAVNRERIDVVGAHLSDVLPAELAERFAATDASVIDANTAVSFIEHIALADDERVWQTVKFVVTTPAGRRLVAGVSADVTEHHSALRELGIITGRFELASRATSEVIVDYDARTGELWTNANLTSLIGYPRSEGVTNPEWWLEKIHPDDRDATVASMREAERARRRFWSGVYRFRRADGTYVHVQHKIAVEYAADQSLMRAVGALADVTDEVEARKTLERRVAERTSQLASVVERLKTEQRVHRQFVGDVAHDLRVPLTTISAELQLLRMNAELGESARLAIARALGEIGRIDHLSGNLMLAAHLGNGGERAGDVVELDVLVFECVETFMGVAAERRIRWEVDIANGIVVIGEPQLLRRAVMNLLDNAVKFSPEEGRIYAGLRRDDGCCVLTISNEGPAIPERELPHVFERYFRGTKTRNVRGTGLGLSIVRMVVEQHGGSVSIDSREDVGTMVSLRMPLLESGEKRA